MRLFSKYEQSNLEVKTSHGFDFPGPQYDRSTSLKYGMISQ